MGFTDTLAKKIMPKNDDTKNSWNSVGFVRLDGSNFNDALFAFDSALEIDPNSNYALIGRAFSLHKLGKIDDAILAYENCIDHQDPLIPSSIK